MKKTVNRKNLLSISTAKSKDKVICYVTLEVVLCQ